jgi:hypothetical protein
VAAGSESLMPRPCGCQCQWYHEPNFRVKLNYALHYALQRPMHCRELCTAETYALHRDYALPQRPMRPHCRELCTAETYPLQLNYALQRPRLLRVWCTLAEQCHQAQAAGAAVTVLGANIKHCLGVGNSA